MLTTVSSTELKNRFAKPASCHEVTKLSKVGACGSPVGLVSTSRFGLNAVMTMMTIG